jgi:hypothetical protein
MINTINSFNPYFTVHHSPSVYVTNTGNLDTGNIKYDVQTQCLKIHNGYQYDHFGGMAEIVPTQTMTDIMEWAWNKMLEEKKLQERLDKYPSLKKAHEQFQILDQLTVEYDKNK